MAGRGHTLGEVPTADLARWLVDTERCLGPEADSARVYREELARRDRLLRKTIGRGRRRVRHDG